MKKTSQYLAVRLVLFLTAASSPHTSSPITCYDPIEHARKREQKFNELLESSNLDLNDLRKLAWKGIPSSYRAIVWQILMGYLPTNKERRGSMLARKRQEYLDIVKQHYKDKGLLATDPIYRQISIDIPRTCPDSSLFKSDFVRESLTKILYCWSTRRPASGYVQGINDLVTPFYDVFLSVHLNSVPVDLEEEIIFSIEADCFWCFSSLVDTIQDNYTFSQAGILRQIDNLTQLIWRTDEPLAKHLQKEGIEFVQFAFRWMNCLLLREFPLHLVIRMWDTYMAEGEGGFSDFHTYVCGAFLSKWSADLRKMEFQEILLFLQSPPTTSWALDDIEVLLSEAYLWKCLFHNAGKHLSSASHIPIVKNNKL